MKPTCRFAAFVAALGCTLLSASAATYYWDGTSVVVNTASDGGAGTWQVLAAGWEDGALAQNWADGNDAVFAGTAGTVTLGGAIAAGTVTFGTTGYIIDTATFNATWGTLAGTGGFTKQGTGTLTLSNASTASGSVTVTGGKLTLGNDTALGTSSVILNGGTIERNVADAVVANAIDIGASGGTILSALTNYATFSGQLTGSGALTVQGLVALNNNTNNYAGALTISNASDTYLRLSASEVLGNATTISLAGALSRLRLDGGVTETIGALSGSGEIFVSKNGAILPGTLKFGSNNGSTSFSGLPSNNDGQLFLVKQGTGTFTFAPTGTSYTGLTISNGTVLATNANGGAGPTVTLGDADTGTNNVAFLTTGSGASRNITVSSSGSGTATIGSTTGAGSGNVTFSGTITLNRATTLTAASTDRTTYTGKITGNVGILTVAGGQRTVIDNGTHDYVGGVVVTGASTVLQTGVGTGTEHIPNGSNVTVDTGAFLKLAGTGGSVETINGLNGAGTVRRHEGVGGVQTLVIGSANGGGTFSGVLLDGAGKLNLTKTGSGNQILSGTAANTYTGLTTVNAGTLTIDKNDGIVGITGDVTVTGTGTLATSANKSGRLGDASNITVDGSGASFQFGSNQNDTINTLAVKNGGTVNIGNVGSNLRPNGGITSTGGGSITMTTGGAGLNFNGATRTVTVSDNTLAISAPISNGGLTKAGNGTLTLSVASSYSGATSVNAGTLMVTNTTGSATGTSAVSVTSGATLAGTGTVSGALTTAGIIAPGTTGIGTLNAGSGVTWNGAASAGATTNWKFNLAAATGSADKLAITGDFTKGTGSVFHFDFLGSAPNAWGNTYTLATWTGTSTTFAVGDFSRSNLTGSYTNGYFTLNSNSLTWTAIPEPTTALAGLLLGAGLLRRKRGV